MRQSASLLLWFLLISFFALPVLGQETDALIIHAGRLFDAENGQLVDDQRILVRGNRIEAVGPDIPIPEGARVVDLRRYTVLPGLIDAHTHLLGKVTPEMNSDLGSMVSLIARTGIVLRALRGR